MNAIFERVSVRQYTEKEIEDEKIELLLKAAMAAPSALNQQPWEFYVVTNKEIIEKLSTCSKYTGFTKDAPLIIVPCMENDTIAPEYSRVDVAASVENILLEATELDLGATWCAVEPDGTRIQNVRDVLDIPQTLTPFSIIGIGYPKEKKPQQNRYEIERIHYVK